MFCFFSVLGRTVSYLLKVESTGTFLVLTHLLSYPVSCTSLQIGLWNLFKELSAVSRNSRASPFFPSASAKVRRLSEPSKTLTQKIWENLHFSTFEGDCGGFGARFVKHRWQFWRDVCARIAQKFLLNANDFLLNANQTDGADGRAKGGKAAKAGQDVD